MDEHINNLVIYQSEDGKTHLEVKYKNGELNEASAVRIFQTTMSNGNNYNIAYYNVGTIKMLKNKNKE